jgi:hypothetical protein
VGPGHLHRLADRTTAAEQRGNDVCKRHCLFWLRRPTRQTTGPWHGPVLCRGSWSHATSVVVLSFLRLRSYHSY